ncbi:hypothetical protein [Geodermatophilus sabuli]|uniref:Uncharacterized protein n=1 Tax=Geodermatophilus sabuli TaxID=1564158 RepID=A0A285EFP3_9ACTN|nr:hypothetical protein [Geodermatophilus sabuli]MBB3082939.1 hypothetical protein [Geodermatophilus sabuli]SNX97938.1 hypothetical protein SAMN06893097_10918 [Geodermatophilus sabuli]
MSASPPESLSADEPEEEGAEYGGQLIEDKAEVRWALVLEGRLRSEFRGSQRALTIVVGLLGIVAGVLGWQASGSACGLATMVATLLLVSIYMLLGKGGRRSA